MKTAKNNSEKWPYIPDHPYRILTIGDSGWGKTNTLLNLIKEKGDINKIYLYAKYLSQPKYEFFIKKRKDAEIKHLNDLNVFIECSITMEDVYENTDNYNPSRKIKILIDFKDMIADIMSNKKFQAVIKELLIRSRKLKFSLDFITQCYFWGFFSHYLIMKINNRKKLQIIMINHSADIDYKDFLKNYRECTRELHYFLTIDTTFPASDSLRFRKNLIPTYKNDTNWSD